jgi:hypothetical protein
LSQFPTHHQLDPKKLQRHVSTLFLLINALASQQYQSILGKSWSDSFRDSHQVFLKGCVDKGFDPVKCTWSTPDDIGTVLVVGDSQAYASADGVIAAANSLGFKVVSSAGSGCPFLDIDTTGTKPVNCVHWQKQVMTFIIGATPEFVVIANRTNGYLNPDSGWSTFLDDSGDPIKTRAEALVAYKESLTSTLARITQSGSEVILLQNIPEPSSVNGQSVLSALMGSKNTTVLPLTEMFTDQTVSQLELDVVGEFKSARILNPEIVLCPKKYCLIFENGQPIYRDNWHLSEFGSKKLSKLFLMTLKTGPK